MNFVNVFFHPIFGGTQMLVIKVTDIGLINDCAYWTPETVVPQCLERHADGIESNAPSQIFWVRLSHNTS